MSGGLLVWAGASPEAPLVWRTLGFEQDLYGEAASLAALKDVSELSAANIEDAVLLLPGEDVRVYRVDLPAKSTAEARAAIPFLLEDDLAVSPSRAHFAFTGQDEAGKRLIAVIDEAVMTSWAESAAGADLTLSLVLPDYLALPCRAGETVLMQAGQGLDTRILARIGDDTGFAIEPDLVAPILAEALESHPAARLRIMADDPDALVPSGVDPAGIDRDPAPDARAALSLFAAGIQKTTRSGGLNLLQGKFKPRRPLLTDTTLFRRAAFLAAIAVVAYLAVVITEGWRYADMADAAEQRAEEIFLEVSPGTTRIVNPRAQINARLAEARAGSADTFLRLSNILFDSVRVLPGVEVDAMRYDSEDQALNVSLYYPDYAAAEQIKEAVSRNGGRMEEGGSRQSGERILGTATVRLP